MMAGEAKAAVCPMTMSANTGEQCHHHVKKYDDDMKIKYDDDINII